MPSHWPELDWIALALDFRFRHVYTPVEDQAKIEAAITRMLRGGEELGLSRVDVEVQADLPADLPKDVVRTITENCQALGIKFTLD